MEVIFTPRLVSKQQLDEPYFLIEALNFIVDNKDIYVEYRGMQPW
jgi:uncharacterized membrane protein YagU involved in acid resistance